MSVGVILWMGEENNRNGPNKLTYSHPNQRCTNKILSSSAWLIGFDEFSLMKTESRKDEADFSEDSTFQEIMNSNSGFPHRRGHFGTYIVS